MEEIIFLEAEIEEDDDLAPVGTLIRKGDEIEEEKVEAPQNNEDYLDAEILDEEVVDEQPVDEPITEEASKEIDDQFLSLDDLAPVEEETAVDEEPVNNITAQKTATKKMAVEDTIAEETPVAEEVPVVEESKEDVVKEIEEPTVEPVIEEVIKEEPIVESEVKEDPIAVEEPVKEEATVIEEKPVKKAPAKKAAPKKKPTEDAVVEEKPVKKAATKKIALGSEAEGVDEALKDSSFEVKEEKKAKVITPKTQETVDVWAVATIVKKDEAKPKKATAKKAVEEPVKEEATVTDEKPVKKAPAKKKAAEPVEEPIVEEKPIKKTSSKKKETTPVEEINDNIEIEENKVEAKKVADVKETKDTEEKILVEADLTKNPNPGKFVIKKTDKGNFVYKLFSFNKRVVAIGAEPYADISSAKAGIKSVEKNAATAPIEDQTLKTIKEQKCPKWIVYQDKKGEFRLRLIASNGNIVATTNDGYTTKPAAIKGIEAIGRAANGAFVVRNDDLW